MDGEGHSLTVVLRVVELPREVMLGADQYDHAPGRPALLDLQARRQTAGEEEMVLAEGWEGEGRQRR